MIEPITPTEMEGSQVYEGPSLRPDSYQPAAESPQKSTSTPSPKKPAPKHSPNKPKVSPRSLVPSVPRRSPLVPERSLVPSVPRRSPLRRKHPTQHRMAPGQKPLSIAPAPRSAPDPVLPSPPWRSAHQRESGCLGWQLYCKLSYFKHHTCVSDKCSLILGYCMQDYVRL